MRYLVEYLLVFMLIFLFHFWFIIRKNKKYDKNKIPVELMYLKKRYNLSLKNITYSNFVWIYSLIDTFIIATVYIIVMYLVKGFVWQIIIGSVLLILLIIICYGLLAKCYLKREGK